MIYKTSIIIPSYKEKENLKKIIPLISKSLSKKEFIFQPNLLVLDDPTHGSVRNCRNTDGNFRDCQAR